MSAQLYNPLVVDDNIEDPNPGNSAHPIINYASPSRRRFTVTQRRPMEPFDQAHSTQLARFPTIPSTNPTKITPVEPGILRSRSQDRTLRTQPSTTLKSKASDISNGESQQSAFIQRLDDIEKRQAKIESLLTQISQNINRNRL
jgi:hypothetical protein